MKQSIGPRLMRLVRRLLNMPRDVKASKERIEWLVRRVQAHDAELDRAHMAMEGLRGSPDNPAPRPVFLHSLWRTGSTHIWNLFRALQENHCLYEPLHEHILNMRRAELVEMFMDGKTGQMRHDAVQREYFDEYALLPGGGAELFRKAFSYDQYVLAPDEPNPSLRRYINSLISMRPDKRAVLGFCRSALRAGWFRRNFDAVNIYILRSAREQWESYLSFEGNYFVPNTFMIAAKNRTRPSIAPLIERIPIPYFEDPDTVREIFHYRGLAARYPIGDQYFVFYYIWLLAFLEGVSNSDAVIDVDHIGSDARAAVHGDLRELGITIDLGTVRAGHRDKYTMPEGEMQRIEQEVEGLISKSLSGALPAFRDITKHLSPAHAGIIGRLATGTSAG